MTEMVNGGTMISNLDHMGSSQVRKIRAMALRDFFTTPMIWKG